ncbi:FAD:protein FMN transferase [Candidatus Nitrosacidococcus tergens]|uniref:FAD:protein FMN transferase n=1 Tax=Candidatus Nitrosacidococcus tergens TaxID=553981 RepID=A0A7G1Q8Z9_9GAMM|nr:FAD:protein FMN transferase [Candidatus Nitrosacidococcus tergens]CAB1275110.1 ApbE family lipoprotein [Candidatus Nitrosacidococcus tergens]
MKLYHHHFKAMGSPCELQIYAKSKIKAERAINQIIEDINRIENLYSRYKPKSFLSQINQVAAIGGHISVDHETQGLLNYAATCYVQSDGLFDITSGILRQAWNFKSGIIPSNRDIQALLNRIGWEKLRWEPPVLIFPLAGMEIDFGGIVKEYTADRVAALAQQAGIKGGLVNLGGDIKIIGPRVDGNPWCIGIRHPEQKGVAIRKVLLHQGAVASSGDYERYLLFNEVRYGHILNPKTGWPVQNLIAVTVVNDLCVVAGSASTIAMLKEEEGKQWLKNLGLSYFWVDSKNSTGGTLNNLSLIENNNISAVAIVS